VTPTSVTRSALGFAALGAGLLHLALAIGADPRLAAGLAVVGGGEFLWGVLAVSRPRVAVPRIALVGALVPPTAWVALLLAGLPGPRPLPMLAATALDLAVAGLLAAGQRGRTGREPNHPGVRIAIVGVAIAAITVPALIATEATPQPGDLPPHQDEGHVDRP
jgi:hypothetical protein